MCEFKSQIALEQIYALFSQSFSCSTIDVMMSKLKVDIFFYQFIRDWIVELYVNYVNNFLDSKKAISMLTEAKPSFKSFLEVSRFVEDAAVKGKQELARVCMRRMLRAFMLSTLLVLPNVLDCDISWFKALAMTVRCASSASNFRASQTTPLGLCIALQIFLSS